jgi:hypothetical protein
MAVMLPDPTARLLELPPQTLGPRTSPDSPAIEKVTVTTDGSTA